MRRAPALALAVLLAASAPAMPSQGALACSDEAAPVPAAHPPTLPGAAAAAEGSRALQSLVQAALDRHRGLGAARALADAAARDVDEARAAGEPQASLSARLGPEFSRSRGATAQQPFAVGAGLSVSGLLWDGGRQRALVDWRGHLADAARLQWLSQQEQIALGALSLALELERAAAQERVWGQYVSTMGCLVDGLAEVVRADRGRASELLQARKALQQAELARESASSQRRQAAIRLQRLVGEATPSVDPIRALLLPLPPLPEVLAAAERASELAQLDRQAGAAEQLARSIEASARPSLSWTASAGQSLGRGGNVTAQTGSTASAALVLSVPLTHAGVTHAADAARGRALAAREQLEDARESRRERVREVHEQAQAALDRATRIAAVLGDSQQLRQATQLQWRQLGRRSLFDVMAAESDHYNLRISQVNAHFDAQSLGATLRSLGGGLLAAAAPR